jgi:hypothetical protein
MTYQCTKCNETHRIEIKGDELHCLFCGNFQIIGTVSRFPFIEIPTKNPIKVRTAKGPSTGIAAGVVAARSPLGKNKGQGGESSVVPDCKNGAAAESGSRSDRNTVLKPFQGNPEQYPVHRVPAPDPTVKEFLTVQKSGCIEGTQPVVGHQSLLLNDGRLVSDLDSRSNSTVRKNRTVQILDLYQGGTGETRPAPTKSGPLCKCGCGRVVEPRRMKGGSPKVFASTKCRNQYHTKEWKKEHPERVREIVRKSIKKYRDSNKEYVRKQARKYMKAYYLKRKGKEGLVNG